MKWVALISLIFLFSSATSRNLKRSAREAEHKSEIAHRFSDLKETTFKEVALITFAQYLQKCPFDELAKLVKDVVDLAHKCVDNEDAAECTKSLPAIFLDEICGVPALRDMYGSMADCCAKDDPERNECFLTFKINNPPFIQPYQRPEPAVLCKDFTDNKQSFLEHYLYRVARKAPFLYAPAILALGADYEHAVEACCAETDIGTCLDEKMSAIKEKAKKLNSRQVYACGILKKFGERVFQAERLAFISQKYPKAPFAEVHKIVQDLKGIYKECCDGDMVECMDDRAELMTYICSKEEAISSKIHHCCEKPVVERSQCIIEADFDDKPADLPPIGDKYIHNPDVCKCLEAGHDAFLAEFLYEYSRRHPEFSTQTCLRIAKLYEDTLEKCCKTENPSECYAKVEAAIQEHIQETKDLIKARCDRLAHDGEFNFTVMLLFHYTKKMPQVSTETMLELGHRMTAIGVKCCQKPEDKYMPCSEGLLSILIQEMCKKQETTHINDQVAHCCDDSYSKRRPCLTKLGVDEKYIPPPFNPNVFNFDEKLCSAPEDVKQKNDYSLLINLVKRKPTITDEQLQKITAGFSGMVDKCCKAEDHDTCFGEEGVCLIEKSRAILGIEG
ncbi:albumin [Alligator mississippiensis]|uniref:Serum albumin n=1 Tax=Alligator mississippiensis TaxID=8496 RepID=A0A151N5S7_ALLMI|nr:albumin [Alligator mississippiensis]KYO31949.1 serum albumin precursor [Alligator mississippiensis]